MKARLLMCAAGLAALVSGCGSDDGSSGSGGSAGAGATGGASGSGGAGGTSGGGSGGSGGTGGDPAPGTMYATYVILGDSISDGGGQAPFYYRLLEQNDDTLYPAYAGRDLRTRFGANLVTAKRSVGGSRAPDLVDQVHDLPATLAGPVLVVVTIGGNDVQAALPALLVSGDDSAQRAAFGASLDTALGELTTADRFGAGVVAHVLLTNIYDPSDGTGDFTYNGSKCPGALALYPANDPTREKLDPWETVMSTSVGKVTGVDLLDLRGTFEGHGVNKGADTWFVGDCIHPNAQGHEHLRELFWDAIVHLP